MSDDVSYRQAMKHDVPHEWAERRKEGVCPVCGKDKTQFQKGLRAFCSPEHRKRYNECFLTWDEMRTRIFIRDDYTCQTCGFKRYKNDGGRDTERMKAAQIQKLQDWLKDPEHAKAFAALREKKLIEISEEYERKYRDAMDDYEFYRDDRWTDALKGIALTPQEEREACPDLTVDHTVALMNGGKMWDEKNLKTMCDNCHVKKTKEDHAIKTKTDAVNYGNLEGT